MKAIGETKEWNVV